MTHDQSTTAGDTGQRGSDGRLPRGSLDPEEIVAAAYRVAGEVGLARFSVPMVARHLGVGVTSIYWHFRKKEDLLAAMSVWATADYRDTSPFDGAGGWKAGLRRHFRSMHRVLKEQPVLVELMLLLQPRPTVDATVMHATSRRFGSIMDALHEAGFSEQDACRLYFALLSHVCGSAMLTHQSVLADAERLMVQAGGPDQRIPEDALFDFTFEALLDRAESLLDDQAAPEAR